MTTDLKFAVNVNSFTHTGDFPGMLEFVRTAEQLGYHNVRFIDHVVGFAADRHPEVAYTPYTHKSHFHEVFTLMAYLSAITKRITFVTGVLGLPQRQTALVAKQAAEVDLLSNGRLILGVGLGYNEVEFRAMGFNFKDRAKRFEEQITMLRALWTQELVTYRGEWHDMPDVNINPLPVQRPIPIWMGAGRTENPVPPDVVLRRIGRLADGWCPLFRIEEGARTLDQAALDCIAKVRDYAVKAGRNPDTMALELGFFPGTKSRAVQLDEIQALREAGATHLHVRTEGANTAEHIDALKRFRDVMESL
jgi:probable F420-dependent oxidoreductase